MDSFYFCEVLHGTYEDAVIIGQLRWGRSPGTQGANPFGVRGDEKLTLIDCAVWEDFIHYFLSPSIHLARRASFILTTALFGRPFGEVTLHRLLKMTRHKEVGSSN